MWAFDRKTVLALLAASVLSTGGVAARAGDASQPDYWAGYTSTSSEDPVYAFFNIAGGSNAQLAGSGQIGVGSASGSNLVGLGIQSLLLNQGGGFMWAANSAIEENITLSNPNVSLSGNGAEGATLTFISSDTITSVVGYDGDTPITQSGFAAYNESGNGQAIPLTMRVQNGGKTQEAMPGQALTVSLNQRLEYNPNTTYIFEFKAQDMAKADAGNYVAVFVTQLSPLTANPG
jgi:hypothetical protein